jgi:hypothetical protein
MIKIVIYRHSLVLKNLNSHLLYSKERSHVCCIILVRFDNGYDTFNVSYTTVSQCFDVLSLVICLLKGYIHVSFKRDFIN